MDPIQPNQMTAPNSVSRPALNSAKQLGQDAFLRLLIEQLKNQDPTNPVEDKEFIAQMAQFNSLEQMMQLNRNFATLSNNINSNQALNLLGRKVSVEVGKDGDGQPIVRDGLVSAVYPGETIKITVAGQDYPLAAIRKISP